MQGKRNAKFKELIRITIKEPVFCDPPRQLVSGKKRGNSCHKGHVYDILDYNDGIQRCSHCKYDTWLRHKYDITIDDYFRMLESQNGVCAICRKKQSWDRRWFCVDHDHKTESVRGLLCNKCNFGISYFDDNPKVLRRAIKYLENQTRSK